MHIHKTGSSGMCGLDHVLCSSPKAQLLLLVSQLSLPPPWGRATVCTALPPVPDMVSHRGFVLG